MTDAESLGVDVRKTPESLVTVGDGSQIPVYFKRLPIKIGPVEFKATLGFSPRLGVGFNLIGRKDIFDRFDVTFSDRRRKLTCTPAARKRS